MADEQSNELETLSALALTWEKKLNQAFLESVQAIKDHIDLSLLIRLIESHEFGPALEMVNFALVQEGMIPFTQTLTDAFVATGRVNAAFASSKLEAAGMSFKPNKPASMIADATRTSTAFGGGAGEATAARTVVAFDVMNPELTAVMRDYQFGLIREITQGIRETIKESIMNSVQNGIGPRQAALDFRDSIGLTTSQERAVMNFRQALINRPMEALRRELRDRRFDPSINRAVNEKKPLSADQIDRMVKRYREKYLKYRSEVIARTESIRSLSMSNRAVWDKAVADGRVLREQLKRFWISTHDGRTRHSHREIPKMNADGVGQDEPFKSPLGNIMYPADPAAPPANTIQCRCAVFTRISE